MAISAAWSKAQSWSDVTRFWRGRVDALLRAHIAARGVFTEREFSDQDFQSA